MKSAAATAWAASILAATEHAPRADGPTPPGPTPAGQATTDLDHDLRVAYLAEVLGSDGWHGVRTLRELVALWGVPLAVVQAYAERARTLLRREYGVDNRKRMVTDQVAALHRLAEKAEAAGNYPAAVRARQVILATAPAAPPATSAGRSLSAEGLPPELARLKSPPASPAEVEHFAKIDEAECVLQGCRVHTRAEAGPVPPAPAASPGAGPMH
jgi:hypothetical protein